MNSKAPAKKKDDAAFDVEQQFILRLPPVRLLHDIAVFTVQLTAHKGNMCYSYSVSCGLCQND